MCGAPAVLIKSDPMLCFGIVSARWNEVAKEEWANKTILIRSQKIKEFISEYENSN